MYQQIDCLLYTSKLSAKLTTAPVENMLKKRGLEPGGPAEKLMGGEALRLSEPYVPKGGGTLKRRCV